MHLVEGAVLRAPRKIVCWIFLLSALTLTVRQMDISILKRSGVQADRVSVFRGHSVKSFLNEFRGGGPRSWSTPARCALDLQT